MVFHALAPGTAAWHVAADEPFQTPCFEFGRGHALAQSCVIRSTSSRPLVTRWRVSPDSEHRGVIDELEPAISISAMDLGHPCSCQLWISHLFRMTMSPLPSSVDEALDPLVLLGDASEASMSTSPHVGPVRALYGAHDAVFLHSPADLAAAPRCRPGVDPGLYFLRNTGTRCRWSPSSCRSYVATIIRSRSDEGSSRRTIFPPTTCDDGDPGAAARLLFPGRFLGRFRQQAPEFIMKSRKAGRCFCREGKEGVDAGGGRSQAAGPPVVRRQPCFWR